MLIGIATSVTGATLIYFLGFNDRKPTFSKLEREQITTEAWKTYVNIENIYIRNSASLLRDAIGFGGFKMILKETLKESEKFQRSVRDVIKTGGVDRDMVSLLERRLENEKKDWPETEKFYSGLDELTTVSTKNNWTQQQRLDSIGGRVTVFSDRLKGSMNRSVNDIEDLSKLLGTRYDLPFSTEDFLIVQAIKYKKNIFNVAETYKKNSEPPPSSPSAEEGKNAGHSTGEEAKASSQYLTGKWDAGGATVTLGADGKSSWLIPSSNTEAKGTWRFKKDELIIDIKKHPATGKDASWVFKVSGIVSNACVITRTTEPFNAYRLVRK